MSEDLKELQNHENLPELPKKWVWTKLGDILIDVEKVNPKDIPTPPRRGLLSVANRDTPLRFSTQFPVPSS